MNAGQPGTRHTVWAVGDLIDDRYEVLEKVSGGMGIVYRVHHVAWNVDLAVKTPRPTVAWTASGLADFEDEARAWVGLGSHPNIAACAYVRRLGGMPRVFAEWVDGGSLSDAITSGRLHQGDADEVLARIIDISVQFARGLEFAHRRGLIHQDVKPGNLLVSTDWSAKVTDFGLATARGRADRRTQGGSSDTLVADFGGRTPGYCSPEQAAAADTARSGARPTQMTRATDVWSWAVSVWAMFAGELPCPRGELAAEGFAAYRAQPTVGHPELPTELADLITRCLDRDPTTRPRDMGLVADELTDLYERVIGARYHRRPPEEATLVADGLNNQALSMLDLGNVDDAEGLWEQAHSADPHHLHTVYNRGLHRWRAAELTDADLVWQLETIRESRPGADVDLLLAQVHLERRDVTAARELLDPSSHGAAAVLQAAARLSRVDPPRTITLEGQTGAVSAIAVSANGAVAVSAGEAAEGDGDAGTIDVWDLRSGTRVRTLRAGAYPVKVVGISADGTIVVAGTQGGGIRKWDLASGAECGHYEHDNTVGALALSADGSTAMSGGDAYDAMLVWSTETAKVRTKLPVPVTQARAFALSGNGRIAVSSSAKDPILLVWDVETGARLHGLATGNEHVLAMALNGDGTLAASAGGGNGNDVQLWDVTTGALLRRMSGHHAALTALAFAEDGLSVVSASWDGTTRVWDVATGRCLSTVKGHDDHVRSVRLSALGCFAVSPEMKAAAGREQTVRLWELPQSEAYVSGWSYARPRDTAELVDAQAATDAAAERAVAMLAAGDPRAAADELRAARGVPGYGRLPRLLELWRETGSYGRRASLQDAWPQHDLIGRSTNLARFVEDRTAVAVSADGKVAVSGGGDFNVRVWDLAIGSCRHVLAGHEKLVTTLSVSADGAVAISGSNDNTMRLWDTVDGRCLYELPMGDFRVTSVAISADGRIAIGSQLNIIGMFDVVAGAYLRSVRVDADNIRSVALSADGGIAIAGCSDYTIRVYDVFAGTLLRTLVDLVGDDLFSRNITSVALSADGTLAASGSQYRKLRFWDVSTGDRIRTVDAHSGWISSVAISADGRTVTSGGDGLVYVWDVESGQRLRTLVDERSGDPTPAGDAVGAPDAGVDPAVFEFTKNVTTQLTGDTNSVSSVSLSSDAGVLVTGGADGAQTWTLDWDYDFRDAGAPPEGPRDAYRRGQALAEREDLPGAIAAYQRAIATGDEEWAPAASFQLGALLVGELNHDDAAVALQAAVESEHSEWGVRAAIELVPLKLAQQQYDAAAALYQWAIDSGNAVWAPVAAVRLGGLMVERGRIPEAVEAYLAAIAARAESWSPTAGFYLGLLWAREHDIGNASKAFRVAMAADDAGLAAQSAITLGLVHAKEGYTNPSAVKFQRRATGGGFLDRATQAFQRAIDSGHPEYSPQAAVLLGLLSAEHGRLTPAVNAYRVAIDSGHLSCAPTAKYLLGVAHVRQTETDLALEAFESAVASGHPEVAAYARADIEVLRSGASNVGTYISYRTAIESPLTAIIDLLKSAPGTTGQAS